MLLPLSDVSLLEAASPTAPPGLRAAIGFCGRVMADLGATVTRVLWDGSADGGEDFLQHGKRILRVAAAVAASLLATLATQSDTAVLDTNLLEAGLRPRRACAVLSMDGTPKGDRTQSEFTIEARAGLLDVVGDPERSPLRLGGHQTAYAAGLAAFTALTAALCQPASPDGPRHVRVNLLETAVWLNWKGLAVAQRTGNPPRRPGTNAEWPVLPCADGYVAVVHRVQEWPRMLGLISDPGLREERFQTVAGRRTHRADLNAILARYFAPLSRAEIHRLSMQHKLPFGPVWAPTELRSDAQMLARGVFLAAGRPRVPVVWHEGPA